MADTRKLRLEIDQLQVESFDTHGVGEGRGTVHGHVPPDDTFTVNGLLGPCTCQSVVNTCQGSCNPSVCHHTCVGCTIDLTCFQSCVWIDGMAGIEHC
jgi:hypothetical protein